MTKILKSIFVITFFLVCFNLFLFTVLMIMPQLFFTTSVLVYARIICAVICTVLSLYLVVKYIKKEIKTTNWFRLNFRDKIIVFCCVYFVFSALLHPLTITIVTFVKQPIDKVVFDFIDLIFLRIIKFPGYYITAIKPSRYIYQGLGQIVTTIFWT